MPVRLAACDPCRVSKLACDHDRPVCSRCREINQANRCNYRERPFKRNKPLSKSQVSYKRDNVSQQAIRSLRPTAHFRRAPTTPRTYPNPGYLGPSSHATIFDRLSPPPNSDGDNRTPHSQNRYSRLPEVIFDDMHVSHGAILIEQIYQFSQLPSCSKLIETWTAKGVNFALAGAFTKPCTQAIDRMFQAVLRAPLNAINESRELFKHSCRPLMTDASTTLEGFCASFCQPYIRWETLGLFFTAAARAAIDVASFKPLYATAQEQVSFQKLAIHFSDRCLEICLSLDCLNDLQLVLQYENFIAHAVIDGDQSYHTWRKLGDVASSLFALGYHEGYQTDASTPAFLQNLRNAAFARAYSADKNCSIFLGRPPRIHRKYCKFRLTGYPSKEGGISPMLQQFQWNEGREFDYIIDTQWSALCATLKEEILDLRDEKSEDERLRRARTVQADAEAQWLVLPLHFRLEGALKQYDREAIERDFMVSAKLNHLHVLFLLHLALRQRTTEHDRQLTVVASKMLGLVVEAVMLKNQMVNSGTGLVWKVAYYGLAAAGIVCLFLLNQPCTNTIEEISMPKIFQDLNVLVAEIEPGALINIEDANYALLSRATHTINRILEYVLSNATLVIARDRTQLDHLSHPQEAQFEDDWDPWANQNFSDFEMDFWLNLAEHPFLSGGEDIPQADVR